MCAAGVASVLMGIAIVLTSWAFFLNRADDFSVAAETSNFEQKGTCVETLTDKQLRFYDYHKGGRGHANCVGDDRTKVDSKLRRLKGSLEVSLHGLYHASQQPEHATNGVLQAVTRDVLTGLLAPQLNATNMAAKGVNFSMAYEALAVVAETDVPTSCDDIYNMDIGALTDDDRSFIKAIQRGKYDDERVAPRWGERRASTVRKPRDSKRDVKTSFPLGDVKVECDNSDKDTEAEPWDMHGHTTSTIAIPGPGDADRKVLFAHCVAQFRYASVGSDHSRGTFGIPHPGELSGPSFFLFRTPDGFDEHTDYSAKVRYYIGLRFGYSAWAYGVILAASCYLFSDSLVFLLAEAGMPTVIANLPLYKYGKRAAIRDSLVIVATSKTLRRLRAGVGFLAIVCCAVFYGVFIALPFGFYHSTMPRPDCKRDDDSGVGTTVDAIGLISTRGGWKADTDASRFEVATICLQMLVLVLLPFTTGVMNKLLRQAVVAAGATGEDGRSTQSSTANADSSAPAPNDARMQLARNVYLPVMVLGSLVLIAGQAIVGQVFGDAWVNGVVATSRGEASPKFDPPIIHEWVFDQSVATFAVVAVSALLVGAFSQRRLLHSLGCFSSILFFSWLVLVFSFVIFGGAIALITIGGVAAFYDENEASSDCGLLDGRNKDICKSRFVTFVVGIVIIGAAMAIVVLIGLGEAGIGLFKVPNSEATRVPPSVLQHLESSELMGPKANMSSSVEQQQQRLLRVGGHRVVPKHPFFNYETRITTSDAFLYAPLQDLRATSRTDV